MQGHGAERSAVIAIQATHDAATVHCFTTAKGSSAHCMHVQESGWNPDRVFVRSNNLFTSELAQLERANKFVVCNCRMTSTAVAVNLVTGGRKISFRRVR